MTALFALSMRCSWLADVISLTLDILMAVVTVAVGGCGDQDVGMKICRAGLI
jgi:hypothetical protein